MMRPILGPPGASDERVFSHKFVFRDGKYDPWPGGGWLNATKSRDPFNAGSIDVLQPGLLLGQEATSQRWKPAFFAKTTAAVINGATTITVGTAQAVEWVRRVGAAGTVRIVGPSTANGVAQVGRITSSAIDTATGIATITATGVNEVQTINIAGTVSGGTVRLGFPNTDGTVTWIGTAAHNATFSTVITNLNTALNATFGTGVIVASGSAYTAIAITFTLTPQNLRPQAPIQVYIGELTGATTATVTETTAGSFGAWAAGSLIGEDDGSYIPKSLVPPGYGYQVADGSFSAPAIEQLSNLPCAGIIQWSQVVPGVTDTGIQAWIEAQMDKSGGGKFMFDRNFNQT